MENKILSQIIASQFKACLGMLGQAIEKVPETLWNNDAYDNPIWQIAYHSLWGTKFYLSENPESFVPFENAIEGAESLGGIQDWENPDKGVKVEGFHTQTELLAYIEIITKHLLEDIEAIPLDQNSGFDWYPYSRLELHINNIRHIQHHTAQIIERLKNQGKSGFIWWADQRDPEAG